MSFIEELKWRGMIHDIMPGTEEQFKKEMKRQEMTKSELAERMQTSRSSVNRLLDPSQPSNLRTLIGAARAIGKHLQLCIV